MTEGNLPAQYSKTEHARILRSHGLFVERVNSYDEAHEGIRNRVEIRLGAGFEAWSSQIRHLARIFTVDNAGNVALNSLR